MTTQFEGSAAVVSAVDEISTGLALAQTRIDQLPHAHSVVLAIACEAWTTWDASDEDATVIDPEGLGEEDDHCLLHAA